ncbi:hypothetical protein NITHO_3430013 [Nitrolancea hollandica Lb]|uniref:Uncharacterized protein n=1 Tax=Nitrolancea hollandica Lb TaxID=1129897 RepID=I4EIF6_9BACT|nr:hypothetical protein NITHO_3430013 [Nitrolancea hollandica Lb]
MVFSTHTVFDWRMTAIRQMSQVCLAQLSYHFGLIDDGKQLAKLDIGRDRLLPGDADHGAGFIVRVEHHPGQRTRLDHFRQTAADHQVWMKPRHFTVKLIRLDRNHLMLRPEFAEGGRDHIAVRTRLVRHQNSHVVHAYQPCRSHCHDPDAISSEDLFVFLVATENKTACILMVGQENAFAIQQMRELFLAQLS